MADSATATLSLLLMEPGSNSNDWINRINDEVLELSENFIAGKVTLGAVGGQFALITEGTYGDFAVLDIRFSTFETTPTTGILTVSLNSTDFPHPRVLGVNNKITVDNPGITVKFGATGGNATFVTVPAGLHAVYIDSIGDYFVW